MSMKIDELQLITPILGTDSMLLDSAAAGTGRITVEQLAQFFTEGDNAVTPFCYTVLQ